MSNCYIPLYRKYRPQKFADLIGQENIVTAFTNAINLNKIAHAYLFCGPRGTGKTSSARILAKSLNCKNGPTLEPCGVCPSCVNITNSNPIDVIEIDAASNRGVDNAQAILEKIQYAPVDGKYKIYIIDEVHMLTTQAFNALLKTLEEPPKNVIFILATTEIHKVLDTIISRCQRFDFRRITVDDIVKRLEFIAKEEKININKDALYNIAKSSQGGMRDSLALLDQVSVLGLNKEITTDDINELLGKISIEKLFELVENFKNSNVENSLTLVNKIYEKGVEPTQIIENLIEYFRDLLLIKNTSDNSVIFEVTKLNEQNINLMRPQAEVFETEGLIYIIDKFLYYLKEIKSSTNRHLWLEIAIIEIVKNSEYLSYSKIIERIQKLEQAVSGGNYIPSSTSQIINLPKPKVILEKEAKKAIETSEISSNKNDLQENQTEIINEEQNISKNSNTQNNVSSENKTEESITEETNKDVAENISSNIQNTADSDIKTLYVSILQNIQSLPSRMFYMNLSRPLEITNEKISIGFFKEQFVKQAQEPTKKLPLENAATSYLGVKDILIEVSLLDENYTENNTPKNVKISSSKPIEIVNKPTIEEKDIEEDEYCEKILNDKKQKETVPDYSDNARMVQELFDGKYMD